MKVVGQELNGIFFQKTDDYDEVRIEILFHVVKLLHIERFVQGLSTRSIFKISTFAYKFTKACFL